LAKSRMKSKTDLRKPKTPPMSQFTAFSAILAPKKEPSIKALKTVSPPQLSMS
jgi:hypothetical protein